MENRSWLDRESSQLVSRFDHGLMTSVPVQCLIRSDMLIGPIIDPVSGRTSRTGPSLITLHGSCRCSLVSMSTQKDS